MALGATARPPDMPDTWEGWEDPAVPPDRLGDYLRDLVKLYDEFGYSGSALYGHCGQGCVHTRIPFDLVTADGIATFRRFIERAADLVVSYGGSFSGEHGDGQARGELLGGGEVGGGVMCPSYMVTREEEDSTRGRSRLLFEMLEGHADSPVTAGWRSTEVRDALDLCLACKGCKGCKGCKTDCPAEVGPRGCRRDGFWCGGLAASSPWIAVAAARDRPASCLPDGSDGP